MTAILHVKRFQLVESASLTSDQFGVLAKKQWFAGLHRLSINVVTAGAAHAIGSSPPQMMKGLVLSTDGLLSVCVSPTTTFPLLVKVMGHLNNGPGTLLGVATIDPSAFFTEVVGTRYTDHPMTSLQITVPVFPVTGLTNASIHALIAAEIVAELPKELMVPLPVPPPLEFRAGPVRVSAADLYFPAFVLGTDGLTVSNVVCVLNVSRTSQWVNIQASASHFSTSPPDGLVLQPGQRGYLSVTLTRSAPNPTSPATQAAQAQPLPSGVLGGGLVAELYTVQLDTREAHAPSPFKLHDDAPRSALEMVRPYHYWLNGSCLTNRPVPADDAVYIRSVLPLFADTLTDRDSQGRPLGMPSAAAASGDSMSDVATGGSADAAAVASAFSSCTSVKDKDSGSVKQATAGGRVIGAVPSRLIVELANRVCRCTIRLGRIRGSAIPVPPICPPFQSGYRAVLTSLHDSWSVEVGETPIILPNPSSGEIDFSGCPLVVRKATVASASQCMKITLCEVTNAAPSGATYTTVQAAPPQSLRVGSDEIPIAVGVLNLWPLHRSAMQRPMAISLLFLDSFSRYDDMPNTGVCLQHSDVTFVPLESGSPQS